MTCAVKYHLKKSEKPNLQVHFCWWPGPIQFSVCYIIQEKILLLRTLLYKPCCSEVHPLNQHHLHIRPAVSCIETVFLCHSATLSCFPFIFIPYSLSSEIRYAARFTHLVQVCGPIQNAHICIAIKTLQKTCNNLFILHKNKIKIWQC